MKRVLAINKEIYRKFYLLISFAFLLLVSCEDLPKEIAPETKQESKSVVNSDSIEMVEALKASMKDDSLLAEMTKKMNDTISANEFPLVKILDSNATTEFVPTLEHKLNQKNNIYSASFLFAWNKLKSIVKSVKESPENSQDFKLVNQSASFKDVLSNTEYTTSVIAMKDKIDVFSFMNLSLEFRPRLENLEGALNFNGIMVEAFGLKHSKLITGDCFQILYIKDDNNFILKLIPHDKNHEIIFVKGVDMNGSFSEILSRVQNQIELGKEDRKTNPWLYTLSHKEDFISIPCISFNFDKTYKKILNQKTETAIGIYRVTQARQKTAMVLNGSGAKVQSLSIVELTKSMRPNKPKSLIFNKPFFIMFRKVNSKYPYFAMTVNNADLMITK
jgi:hypothetical protein